MELSNGVLIHYPTNRERPADATVTLTKAGLLGLIGAGPTDALDVDGDAKVLTRILALTDAPDPNFAVVTP